MSLLLNHLLSVTKRGMNSRSRHRRDKNAYRPCVTPLRLERLESRLVLSDIVQPVVNWGIQVEYAEPIGQTFTAEDASIESLGFKFSWGYDSGSLTVSLYEGVGTSGPLLGSQTLTLPEYADPNRFIDFDFSSVTLTPGSVYTAMLDIDEGNDRWGVGGNGGRDPDAYPGGTWIFWGEVQSDPGYVDLAFRVLVNGAYVPAIALDKVTGASEGGESGDGLEFPAGTPITWTYAVVNAGNVQLENVSLSDDQGVTPLYVSGDDGNGLLDVDETWIYQATGVAELGAHENVGTVTADDVHKYEQVSASDASWYFGCSKDVLDIELVSIGDPHDPAAQLGNDASTRPAISGDGRYVAFVSDADNLTPGDLNAAKDVFVKDLHTGALTLVSTAADGTQGNAAASPFPPSLSFDGRYVAFASRASNLVPRDRNGNAADIFVKDLKTGMVTLASAAPNGDQGPGADAPR